MYRRFALPSISAALLLLAAPTFPQTAATHSAADAWWANVRFLADDHLEGRQAGSEGLRKAQAYVVEQFKKAGLEPAGTDGFYQPVKFVSREIVESGSSAALISGGKAEPLVLGDDAYFSTRANLAPDAITAKLVFI